MFQYSSTIYLLINGICFSSQWIEIPLIHMEGVADEKKMEVEGATTKREGGVMEVIVEGDDGVKCLIDEIGGGGGVEEEGKEGRAHRWLRGG